MSKRYSSINIGPIHLLDANQSVASGLSFMASNSDVPFGVVKISGGPITGLVTLKTLQTLPDPTIRLGMLFSGRPEPVAIQVSTRIEDNLESLVQQLSAWPDLPGVIVLDGQSVRGVIPRKLIFDMYTKRVVDRGGLPDEDNLDETDVQEEEVPKSGTLGDQDEAAAEPGGPRFLNAGLFTSAAAPVPTDQPLALDGGPYRLGVNAGAFWGPGAAGAALPDALLDPFFEQQDELEVDVVASSPGVGISPAVQKMALPRRGDSALIYFDLALQNAGRQIIDVDLVFHGHMLQNRRIEFEVLAQAGQALPAGLAAQDGHTLFTRTTQIEPASLAALKEKPSPLTIVTGPPGEFGQIMLRFLDTTRGELGVQQSELTAGSLKTVLQAVRGQLLQTMNAYLGTIGGPVEVLQKHLGLLAEMGRSFYMALMPGLAGNAITDAAQKLNIQLPAGAVIQVAPLSAQLGVPWELLYERPVELYRPDRTKLCDSFLTHGPNPEDCPHNGDVDVVCPYGFWGYRYIIEQLPCSVAPGEHVAPVELPMRIFNGVPLRFNAIVFSGFGQMDPHLQKIRELSMSGLSLERFDSLDKVRQVLSESPSRADILYFFTHGGTDPFGRPVLIVGGGDTIKLVDLNAWNVTLSSRHPLVLINACESADYSPDAFENLVKFFCQRGAAGVIGTQCEIKENLANAFSLLFLAAFLRRAPAGEALYAARLSLLRDKLDPRGLAYSLFAASQVQLSIPVLF